MSDHFNELLLQTLENISNRLHRLESRVDRVMNEKSDKADVRNLKTNLQAEINGVQTDLKTLRDEVRPV